MWPRSDAPRREWVVAGRFVVIKPASLTGIRGLFETYRSLSVGLCNLPSTSNSTGFNWKVSVANSVTGAIGKNLAGIPRPVVGGGYGTNSSGELVRGTRGGNGLLGFSGQSPLVGCGYDIVDPFGVVDTRVFHGQVCCNPSVYI